jgi:hypothetical protein
MLAIIKKYWPVNLIVGCLLVIAAYCLFSPNWKGFYENSKIFLIFCGAFIVSSSLFTAFLCQRKATRRQKISYRMVLPVGFFVSIFTVATGLLILHGTRVFTVDYWSWAWRQTPMLWFWMLGLIISLIVAFDIVVYSKEFREMKHRQPKESLLLTYLP